MNITQLIVNKHFFNLFEVCWKIPNQHNSQPRRTFKKEVRNLKMSQRWYRYPGNSNGK